MIVGTDTRSRLRALAQEDQRVWLHADWEQYEAMLAIRGEKAVPRMTYVEGTLELMTPSINHEYIKKNTARLIEAYADEMGIDINGYGSWTLKNKLVKRGAEPDECYVLGAHQPEKVPDWLIEVDWTPGGIDKRDLYYRLGVPEVWVWSEGQFEIHHRGADGYERVARSKFLPDLDIELLAQFATRTDQSQAVREFRAALRARRG